MTIEARLILDRLQAILGPSVRLLEHARDRRVLPGLCAEERQEAEWAAAYHCGYQQALEDAARLIEQAAEDEMEEMAEWFGQGEGREYSYGPEGVEYIETPFGPALPTDHATTPF